MAVAAGIDRRALLGRGGWRAAGAELKAALGPLSFVSELTVARRAMACEFSVTFPANCRSAVEAGCLALDEVERIETKLSVFISDSDISRVNRTAASEPAAVDAEVFAILHAASRISAATGGAFDAASGALVRAWGFRGGPKRVPCEAERLAAMALSGSSHVVLDDARQTVRFKRQGVEYNLGGIGKGFAIDRAMDRIRRELGIRAALMQGGQSSMKAFGTWTVAIGSVARVRLRNQALGTSGSDNQFFVDNGKRYGHLLDPRTGWPAVGLRSASAIAPCAAEADALSTAFYVLGVERTREYCRAHPDVGAVLVTPSGALVIGSAEVEVTK
jgi:thiamine biosynthesis lipoprotein